MSLPRGLVDNSQLEADFLHPGHRVTWLPKVACQTDHSLKQGAVALGVLVWFCFKNSEPLFVEGMDS